MASLGYLLGAVAGLGGVVLFGIGVEAGDDPGGCVPGTTPGAAFALAVRLFSTFWTP